MADNTGGSKDSCGLFCEIDTRPARWAATDNACWVSTIVRLINNTFNSDRIIRHIEVNPEHNGNLFFWHFQNRHIANRQRTVIWLNGGPGCSSMDGAFMEIGPYRLKDDAHLRYNDGSWDEFSNLLFVDNPVGTGFSYVNTDSFVTELPEMARQMVIFFEHFFQIFPQYEDNDVSSNSGN